jgi:serine/threonine-protein kinase
VAKIIDFGIVAVAAGEHLGSFTEQLTATGKIIGTPRYMSPEQLLGAQLDARSDLYALGLIAYELLSGQPAFESADPRRLAWLHAVGPPPLLPDVVPDELARARRRLRVRQPTPRVLAGETGSRRQSAPTWRASISKARLRSSRVARAASASRVPRRWSARGPRS